MQRIIRDYLRGGTPQSWNAGDSRALITPELLDGWLARHEPDQTVGSRLSMRCCPLACYLSERTGYTWLVSGDWARPSEAARYAEQVTLAPWLVTFTELADAHPEQTVTAAAARDYLKAALRGRETASALNE